MHNDDDIDDDDDDDDNDDDDIYLAASSDTFLSTLMAFNTLPTFRTFLLYYLLYSGTGQLNGQFSKFF